MTASPSSTSHLRKELQEYIRTCERLLYSTIPSAHAPLSDEEREMVAYCQDELKAQLIVSRTH